MAAISPASGPAHVPHEHRAATPAQRLRKEHGGEGVADVLPWLLTSLGVHIVVFLILLAFFRFGGAPLQREVIRIDTDLVDIFEGEPSVQRRLEIDPTKAVSDAERREALMRSLRATGTGPEAVMDVDPLDLGGLEADLALAGGPAAAGRPTVGDLTRRVGTGERGMREVLDEIARRILDVVDRRTLLVVILFDQSRSLEDTRRLFNAQLGRTFQDVNLSITDAQEQRLRWCVVGFGNEVRPMQAPTRDLDKVKQAIETLPWDDTGVENVAQAMRYVVQHLSRVAERTMVLLITDEEGDDLGVQPGEGPSSTIPEVGKALRDANTILYVLAPEAMFHRRLLIYTPQGAEHWGYLERGLPTRRLEAMHDVWHAQVGHSSVWSGFGAYSLASLARHAGGKLFVLSDRKQSYDPKALEGYEPEIIAPDDYDDLARRSELRAALLRIVDEAPRDMPFHWRNFQDTWSEEKRQLEGLLRAADKKIEWVRKSLDELRGLRNASRRERSSPKRWQANYELTVAQLFKMEAMLLQYRYYVNYLYEQKEFPTPSERGKRYVWYEIRPVSQQDRANARFMGKEDERAAVERARNALAEVADRHRGTPWGDVAQWELNHMVPYRLYMYTEPRPTPPAPERPKL